jgi:hypothetical protein
MYILSEYYSDLALNKICFWHFITMSQLTKRRWNSGPSTPSSTSKKKKYNCKFQDEWKKSHHWLQSSLLGNDLAFCTLCSSNFSVASGGLYDIKRHSETSLHKKAVTATNKTPQLHQFMPTKSVDDQVTRAETLFSNFVAEHNLPFTVSDHFTDLCRKMFPESKIDQTLKEHGFLEPTV